MRYGREIRELAEVMWRDAGGHPGEFHAQDQHTITAYEALAAEHLRWLKATGGGNYDTLAEKKMDRE